jgi:hypothetical protein
MAVARRDPKEQEAWEKAWFKRVKEERRRKKMNKEEEREAGGRTTKGSSSGGGPILGNWLLDAGLYVTVCCGLVCCCGFGPCARVVDDLFSW